MKSVSLTAYPRTLTRRIGIKKLRSNGRIPAVIYGRKTQPQNLEVERKDLENVIHHSISENRLVELSIPGADQSKRLALMQAVQHHPLNGQILHVDLHEVSEDEKVTIQVPVETVGEPAGVKTGGGVLEHVLFKLRVRALVKDLPEYIQIDVTNLELGQTIHVGDIQVAPGVEVLGDKGISVVSIAAPRSTTEEAEAEAAAPVAAGQVEMIKEKKEEAKSGAPEKKK